MFKMTENTKLNLHEIENMIIWERDVYVTMMNMEIEKKNEEIRERRLTS